MHGRHTRSCSRRVCRTSLVRGSAVLRSLPRIVARNPVRLGRTPSMEVRHMSVVVRFNPAGLTHEQYDEAVRRLEAAGAWPDPDGLEVHVLFGSEGDLRVSEIWDSREQLQAFGDKLMPILQDVGIEFSADPEIFEVHNLVKR